MFASLELMAVAIMVLTSVIVRFSIGTFCRNRYETVFKTRNLPKPLNYVFGYVNTKLPISFHSMFFELSVIVLALLLAFGVISRRACLYAYGALWIVIIGALFIETVVTSIVYKNEFSTKTRFLSVNYDEGKHSLYVDNKLYLGYFERYYNKRCIFYDENNKIIMTGEYKIDRKNRIITITDEKLYV